MPAVRLICARRSASCSATRSARCRPAPSARRGRRAPTARRGRRGSGAARSPASCSSVDIGQVAVVRGAPRDEPTDRSRARRGTARPGAPAPRQRRWPARTLSGAAAAIRSVSNRRVAIMPVNAGSSDSKVSTRVEDRLLVFLQVAVVGERQALERGEQPGEVADQPAGLAARELGDVGVLLLRHDRRPGRVGVVELDEAELRGGPEDDLLAEAGEVRRRSWPRQNANSATKSRSRHVPSIEFAARRREAELARATASGSRPSEEPASAPAP